MLIQNDKHITNENKNNIIKHLARLGLVAKTNLPTIKKVTISGYKKLIAILKFELIGLSTCIANAMDKKNKIKQVMAFVSLGIGAILGTLSLANVVDFKWKAITIVYCLAILPYMNSNKTLKQIMYSSDKFDRLWQNLGFKRDPENGKGYPILTNKNKDEYGNHVYDFLLNLNPSSKIENRIEAFEEIVEKRVLKVDTKTIGHIKITCAKSATALPKNIYFGDKYISKDDATAVIGVSHFGNIKINLRKLPHTLIGGHTGAGKSNLLKAILNQYVEKGFEMYGVDYKKGNALKVFKNRMHISTTRQQATDMLNRVFKEMDKRYEVLEQYPEYDKIDQLGGYSKILVVVDELAELLSGTKDEVNIIMEKLMSIARLGRGADIYLLLATQRASGNLHEDFTSLRDLMGYRISGYASNNETSKMILNNNMATKIDEELQGRFMILQQNTTIEFQCFNFSDVKVNQDIIANNKTILTKEYDITEVETILPKDVDLDTYFEYLTNTKDSNNCVVGYQKAKEELGITEYTAKKFHKELQDTGKIYYDEDLRKSKITG